MLERSEETIAICAEIGASFFHAWGSVLRGWARSERGDAEGGLGEIRAALDSYRASGSSVERTRFLALRAEVEARAGRLDEALATLAQALALARATGERYYEPELHRLDGELRLRRGDRPRAEAEKCFRRAIALARRQGAKGLELRAEASLARLGQPRR